MESPTPVSCYVHQNSKKRVFLGGSSSSVCKDVEVLEIVPPANHTSKPKSSKRKEVICHEIIDVDVEEDCGDVMIIDTEVNVHGKGKEALSAFSVGIDGLATDGLVCDIQSSTNVASQSHDSMNIDDSSSNNFFGEEDWLENYYDDLLLFDEYTMLESHFDHMDIPPGIEAPFPWLPSSPRNKNKVTTTGTSTNSSLQLKSDDAIVPSSLNSPLSPWPLPSRSKSTSQPQKLKLPYKSLEPGVVPKKSTVSSSTSFLGSQSASGSLALKHGKEPLHCFGKSKRKTRASQVTYNGPLGQLSSGASYPPIIGNHASSSLKLKMPSSSPGMETYMPPWQDLRLNMLGPSIGPSGFLTEFVTWPQDSTSIKNGESPMVIQTTEPRNIDEVLQNFEGFKKFDTVEDYSDHFYSKNASSGKQPPKNWAKRIQEEWKILEKDLPDTIFVRVYEARMDLLRAVIVGAEGTPYHDGLFFFDVFFPSSYPNVPPLVHYHSGGLRINPNLYNCGKVCLSLLNTWSGNHKEKWIPGVSTMLQVLVSIQGLILNAKPYFNEPGYANMSGSPTGEKRSLEYNESTYIYSLQTMVYSMRRPPKHFEDFVMGHYCKYARDIMVSCKAYLDGAQVGCLVKGGVQDVDEGDKSCSQHFKNSLAGFIPTLVDTFSQIGAKDCQEFLSLSQKATGLATAAPRPLKLYH